MASTSYGSSSTNNSFVFDIFINHRGPDSKKTLAKHLYDRLTRQGLRVFLDEDELQGGEYITPQIQSAIRTASVHIAIFSPGYADSNWCLDELLLMFQSVLESRSTIIPVYYGVQPADLQWVTSEAYARSLQRLEKKRKADSTPRYDPDTIQKWRKALTDAAQIKGFMKAYNDDEQQFLEQVVKEVLKKVKRPLHVSRYPTGLDEKVAEFEEAMLLDQQSSRETRVIGIVGLGGAGKTTLAKEIFNRRRLNYKQTCFLFDVRENVARNSLKSLQTKILSDFGIKENVQIDSTDDGIEKLQRYLRSSHAFLILDDVDHLQQVEALLLPAKDVVQQGSLILATSRNKDVLTSSGIAESSIFKLEGLDQHHSQELFCWHAFDQRDPPKEFEQVARAFVDACAGLPLSLKVLGSLLRRKDLECGKALFHHISKKLPEEIMATLKISYDSLDKIEKQIFLDIVCFFIGEDKDTAIRIWDGTEWGGSLRLQNLESRCLVEVDNKNRIRMHNHVRDLGRHIAETEPPEWTLRLSCPTHELRLLSNKSVVRGISTGHSKGCQRAQPLFTKLKEFAGSSFTNYVRGLQLISTEGWFEKSEFIESTFPGAMSLIWLCWVDFPYSSLPPWIPLKNLRVLRIERRRSDLPMLRVRRFSDRQTLWLHESQAPEQLRELYVKAIDVEVPKSIGKLSHLEKIMVNFNDHLTLPDELCHLQSLKHFELRGGLFGHIRFGECTSLNMLPDSFGNLTNLQTIYLECSNLQVLPDSFGNLTNLQTIDLSWCSSLQVLPNSFGDLMNLQTIQMCRCESLQVLPDSFGNLTNLQTIDLSWCSSLQVLPDSFGDLMNLQTIKLSGCWSLRVLPDSFGNLTNLQTIDLSWCSSLQVLPDSFGNLMNLQTIDLSWCSNLQVLPDSFGNLMNLQTIKLYECWSLRVLPDSFGNLIQLEGLEFDSLTVSYEVYEKMHTFKCSGVIDFKRVLVLPAGFLRVR